jgi:hypothetical protein
METFASPSICFTVVGSGQERLFGVTVMGSPRLMFGEVVSWHLHDQRFGCVRSKPVNPAAVKKMNATAARTSWGKPGQGEK